MNWSVTYGWIELFNTERIENGVWILGGRSIVRDRQGNAIETKEWDNLRVELP